MRFILEGAKLPLILLLMLIWRRRAALVVALVRHRNLAREALVDRGRELVDWVDGLTGRAWLWNLHGALDRQGAAPFSLGQFLALEVG